MILKFKTSTALTMPYGHALTSVQRDGKRPYDIELNLSDIQVDWDDPSDRNQFCDYVEHLQKQCNLFK